MAFSQWVQVRANGDKMLGIVANAFFDIWTRENMETWLISVQSTVVLVMIGFEKAFVSSNNFFECDSFSGLFDGFFGVIILYFLGFLIGLVTFFLVTTH